MSGRVVQFKKQRGGRSAPFLKWLLLAALTAILGFLGFIAWKAVQNRPLTNLSTVSARHFKICDSERRTNCVVDGDTVWIDGVKIRLETVDTPEVYSPLCAREKQIGDRATLRLQALMNEGDFEMWRSGKSEYDRYGRVLRTLGRDGKTFGNTLLDEGLAGRWGGQEVDWCNGG